MRTDMYYILKDLGVSAEVLNNLDEDEAYKSQTHEFYGDMFRRSMRGHHTHTEDGYNDLAA